MGAVGHQNSVRTKDVPITNVRYKSAPPLGNGRETAAWDCAIRLSALSNHGAGKFAFEDSSDAKLSTVRPPPTRYIDGEDRRFEVATAAHTARSGAARLDGVQAFPSPVRCEFCPHGSKSGNRARGVASVVHSAE